MSHPPPRLAEERATAAGGGDVGLLQDEADKLRPEAAEAGEDPVFGSLMVDANSATPYTDATKVIASAASVLAWIRSRFLRRFRSDLNSL